MNRIALLLCLCATMLAGTLPAAPAADAGTLATPTITTYWEHDPIVAGTDWTVLVEVTAGGSPATGTVHLESDGVELTTPQALVEGRAAFHVDGDALAPGTAELDFVYDGDGSTAPAQVSATQKVWARAPLQLTIADPPGRHSRGRFVVTATAPTASAPEPTGRVFVRYTNGREVRRKEGTLVNGRAVIDVRPAPRGHWSARARYLGDGSYYWRSSSPSGAFVVR